MSINLNQIKRPVLLIDEAKTKANIAKMARQAAQAGVSLRPHFKTHQSAAIGDWFRDAGTRAITVSSVTMARYFAANGWQDINIAFPVNRRELAEINELAQRLQRLHLVIEDRQTAILLDEALGNTVTIWIKIDAGSGRTGIQSQNHEVINLLAQTILDSRHLALGGLLTHAGHTYGAPSPDAIKEISSTSLNRLTAVKNYLAANDIEVRISIGDTPGSSLVDRWPGVDEIRPGNYVFYDAKQASLGSCSAGDIAVAVACPVVAKHSDQNRLVLYGGAVHLSKDHYQEHGRTSFGRLALWEGDQWRVTGQDNFVSAISQEHGVVSADEDLFSQINIGDLLLVLPAHSCLTVDLYAEYVTMSGRKLPKMRTNE